MAGRLPMLSFCLGFMSFASSDLSRYATCPVIDILSASAVTWRSSHLEQWKMPYLIGTDEAGYAPNLGPLVITATVWHVADGETDLYRQLKKGVCRSPSRKQPLKRVAWADSKALYKPPNGMLWLERGVLAALGLCGPCPASWDAIWRQLDIDAEFHLRALPWHAQYQTDLPLIVETDELQSSIGRLQQCCGAAGVRLVGVASTAVFPDRWNRCTIDCGNKGEALSTLTLRLLDHALRTHVFPQNVEEPVIVVCDKHGGRNRYGRLLQQQFPDTLVEVYEESLAESVYRWTLQQMRIETRFRMGGESFLPTALASMVSKYLRELAMRAFNDFWCCEVPNLRPTAGYPSDARRFKKAISERQLALRISDDVLWRNV
jgi:ribonuclease HII